MSLWSWSKRENQSLGSPDRKSTRLNSSHTVNSYAVFCLKKKKTAPSGPAGLAVLTSRGPFAVVMADLHMPGMNGIQFLTAAREIAPDTVRLMLTGFADLQ